jgi:mono/diheme cytochrome c family protein
LIPLIWIIVIKFEWFIPCLRTYNVATLLNRLQEGINPMKPTTLFALIAALFTTFATFQAAHAEVSRQDDLVAQGKYIATIAGCTSCHTPLKAEYQNPQSLSLEQIQALAFNEVEAQDKEKYLAGGRLFDLGPAGQVFTVNITPDEETGIGAWSDDQMKLAIKTGIDNEGKLLFPVMPYHVYSGMADADLEAVIAYLKSVEAVSNQVPERTVSTEGMPSPPFLSGIVAPDASDPTARGAYLVNSVMGCTDCHTPIDPATGAPQLDKYLAGRQPYEGPWGIVYGGNITPDDETGLGAWTDDEVKRAILSGVGKDGRRLILMPWFAYSSLTAEDADAVVSYLQNGLAAVNNAIPAASLNEGFLVMAPEAVNQPSAGNEAALSPIMILVIGIGIILLVSLAAYYFRQQSA